MQSRRTSERHSTRKTPARLIALFSLLAPSAVWAGPPFLTDDPAPTDPGHWEIYGPLVEVSGRGADFEGATGLEASYGAATDLQLSIAVPIAFAHDSTGYRWGAGDVELSVKYRFYNDEASGFSASAFPEISLPTATNGMGNGKVTGFLPIWLQKDLGDWSVFGGGGHAINPGAGNRNYWTGGIAVSNQVTPKLLIGVEANRQGADTVGGNGSTSLGIGAIYQLQAPFRVLASGGPTFEDGGGASGFHAFLALGMDF